MPHDPSVPVLVNAAGSRPSPIEDLREIVAHGHLLANLVRRDLTVRYKRSVLGFLWTMLNPLLLMIIFTVVFSTIFRFAVEHYETYFLSEYLVWNFFAQSTVAAMTSLEWNGALMKRVRVPKAVFAVSTTASGLANLLLACLPLLVIMALAGAPIRPAMLFLPFSFAIIAVFTLGVSLALSAVSVYFDDVAQMVQVAITALMYLTPIMYPMSIVPERYQWLIRANPLTHLFELTRQPIYHGVLPDLSALVLASAIALAALLVGWLTFRRLSPGFYLHL
ncbi:MAG: ABC transporter permease [Acidobacteriota bacterium]